MSIPSRLTTTGCPPKRISQTCCDSPKLAGLTIFTSNPLDEDEMYDSYDEKELKREEKRIQREQKKEEKRPVSAYSQKDYGSDYEEPVSFNSRKTTSYTSQNKVVPIHFVFIIIIFIC